MESAPKKQKTDEEPVLAEASRQVAPGGGGGLTDTSGRTSETAVSIPPTITYGFQETHTCVMPCVAWFSAPNLLPNYKPTTFKLRLNGIYSIMDGTIKAVATPGEFWTAKCTEADQAGTNANVANPFPSQLADVNMNYEFYPWYRDTYEKLYMYYTVLGCEYEIIIHNPGVAGRRALVAHSVQTASTAAGSTSVFLPNDIGLKFLMGQKGIQFEEVAGRDSGQSSKSNMTILKGTYKPGTALRDVSNDGDVKLWSKTDETGANGEVPSYTEFLQVMSYQSPFSHAAGDSDGIGATNAGQVNLNYQVRVKYIVQFKQLRQSVRYPNFGGAATQGIVFPAAGTPYPVA
mgnify:CR=1 FL=1